MAKARHNPREVAEIVAVQALGFIAGEPERLGAFLSESGIGPETLRAAAGDPQFLGSVLDFILRDDATVTAFSKASDLHPTTIAAARQALDDTALDTTAMDNMALGDSQRERDVP